MGHQILPRNKASPCIIRVYINVIIICLIKTLGYTFFFLISYICIKRQEKDIPTQTN